MHWQLHPITEFPRFASAWNAVNAAASDLPFLRSEFLSPALDEFGSGREVVATFGERGEYAAMGVFRRSRRGMWETFQPSQLPLGAFLLRAGTDIDPVLEGLLRALPGVAVAVAVTQQDPTVVGRPRETSLVETLDYIETPTLTLQGTFDDYWSSRGKNLRHNVKRQRAKLAEQAVSLELDVIDSPAHVAAAMADYGRLEGSGWKAQQGTAVRPDNAQGRFYCKVFETFLGMGAGRIYRYRFGDQVVAMDLCLESGGVLVVLKTTYDEQMKVVSPATLMRHEIMQRLFAEGRISRIEFYGKAMEWHLRWTSELRTLYHLNRYRWKGVKRLRAALGQLKSRGPAAVIANGGAQGEAA